AHEHETEESKAALADAGRLIEDEEREQGRVAKSVYLQYFQSMGGIKVGLFLFVVQTMWQVFQIGSDLWLSHWTDEKVATYDKDETEQNMTIYALLGAGSACMVLVRTLTISFFGIRASRRLFDSMTDSLLHAPLKFFDANPIGRIVNRYGDDTSTVDFQLPFTYGSFLAVSFFTVFQLATAVYMVDFLGLLILPLVYIYVKIANFYLAPYREISRLSKVSASPVLSHLTQSEEGVALIRAFGPEYTARMVEENFRCIDVSNTVWYVDTVVRQWFQVRMQLIGSGVVIVIVSGLVYLHKFLSPGLVGLVFTYALSIDGEISSIVQSWSQLEILMVSPERILEYANIPAEGSEKVLVIEPPA
ncbi:Abc transporter c family member 5, partial [Globisporangium polare]